MSKTTITTKANSVFLATVLVAGIIALSYPSFMVGPQAQEFMEWTKGTKTMGQTMEWTAMETSIHMEKTTTTINPKIVSVNVKKILCNNFNINGLEIPLPQLDS